MSPLHENRNSLCSENLGLPIVHCLILGEWSGLPFLLPHCLNGDHAHNFVHSHLNGPVNRIGGQSIAGSLGYAGLRGRCIGPDCHANNQRAPRPSYARLPHCAVLWSNPTVTAISPVAEYCVLTIQLLA